MKLKKVIIDGKVYYQEDTNGTYEFSKEENNSEEDIETVEVDDDTTFNEKVKRYANKLEEKMRKIFSQMGDECKDIANQIQEATNKFKKKMSKAQDEEELDEIYDDCLDDIDDMKDAMEDKIEEDEDEEDDDFFTKIASSFNDTFSCIFGNKKSSKKNKNLAALFPFMDNDDIHELVLSIISGKEKFDFEELTTLMPFVSKEDADLLFDYALKNDDENLKIVNLAPFVSKEKLDIVVDKYISGEITKLKIESLYPFLSKDSIKKLFKYYKSQD